MSELEIAILVILSVIALFISLFLYFQFKRKRIRYRNYLNLMDIGKELKDEIKSFIAKKTNIKFTFITLDNIESYDKIKCEWLDSEININNIDSYSYEIKNMETYNESNCYIELLIKQKIQLKNKNKTTEFIIDIYLHQDNNYYILTNILENPVYSLDTIFISKKEELIPKKLTFENYDLFSDDYGLNNMRRICLINIEKNSLINFINSSSRPKLTGGEQIFEHKYHDLLLNIRIQEGDSFNSSLFINQKPGEIYDFTPQEIDILNRFDSNVIDNYLNKYKNFETDSITEEMETSFKRDVKKFISLNFYDEENNIENNKFESIPLLSEDDEKEDIINNHINNYNCKYN